MFRIIAKLIDRFANYVDDSYDYGNYGIRSIYIKPVEVSHYIEFDSLGQLISESVDVFIKGNRVFNKRLRVPKLKTLLEIESENTRRQAEYYSTIDDLQW